MFNWLKNLVLRNLLRTATEDEFLRYDEKTKKLMIGNDVLPDADARMLINEAETIQQMYLYKLLRKELTYILNQKIFEESSDFNNVWFGKGGLYFLDIYHNKILNLSKLEPSYGKNEETKRSEI